ncbi:MAG: hypothetical protein ACO32I_06455 [Candidatus Limnocylindrus sp.]
MTKFDDAFTASPEDARVAYDGVTSKVDTYLTSLGITLYEGDQLPTYVGNLYNGILPPDLDVLTYTELAALMSAHMEWTRYVQAHLTRVQSDVLVLTEQLGAIKSAVTRQRGKDAIESDRRYIAVNVSLAEMRALLLHLEAADRMNTKSYTTLSRVVTVRGQDQDTATRVNSIERGHALLGRRS